MVSTYLGFVFMLYGRDGTLQFSVDRFIYEFFYAEKFNPEYMDYYKLDDNRSHYFLFFLHGVYVYMSILVVWPMVLVFYTVYIIVGREYVKRYKEEEEKEYKEDNYEPV